MRTPKTIAIISLLLGLLACWLMWHEAGLPPQDRPLRIAGGDSRQFITENPYPESCIAFAAGMCIISILGILGLVRNDDGHAEEWRWAPAFCVLGALLLLLVHQARRVNGIDMAEPQAGHILGLCAGAGVLAAGAAACIVVCRTPSGIKPNA
jgi:hypothetical protein